MGEKAEESYFRAFDCLSQVDTLSQVEKVYVPVCILGDTGEDLRVHFLKLLWPSIYLAPALDVQ